MIGVTDGDVGVMGEEKYGIYMFVKISKCCLYVSTHGCTKSLMNLLTSTRHLGYHNLIISTLASRVEHPSRCVNHTQGHSNKTQISRKTRKTTEDKESQAPSAKSMRNVRMNTEPSKYVVNLPPQTKTHL